MIMGVTAQGDSALVPKWSVGEWTGRMGNEFSDYTYPVKFLIRAEAGSSRMTILSPHQEYVLTFESTQEARVRGVRFIVKPVSAKDTLVCRGGTIDLQLLPDWPSTTLHVQFYPEGKHGFWLGEISRRK